MSGPVSYASAARSAASKDSNDPQDLASGSSTPTVSTPSRRLSDASAEPTDASSAEPEAEEKDESKDSSINKEKVSLTPAPVPKVNAWKVTSVPSSAPSAESSAPSTTEPSPSASNSVLATDTQASPLNPMHWPKPDEGTTPGDKKDIVASSKARPGKEKWIPLNYTPVTSKPRGNKPSRSGNSGKSSHTASNSSTSNGTSAKGRGAKNFASKGGSQKKTEKSAPAKSQPQRTASVSSVTSAPGKDAAKAKSASTTAATTAAATTATATTTTAAPKSSAPKKGRFANGSEESTSGHHHHSHAGHHNHHNNHHNYNARSASGNFNQQFVGYNGRRSAQLSHGGYNKYFMPDYAVYGSLYQQAPGQNQYEMTVGAVVYQIEYYFSVENLCKDMFLRKQMNSNGWVPMNILASFNRLKSLTGGDFNLFLEACKWAPSVETSGTKIRARQNWEHWIFPASERLPAGKDEEPLTSKLVFNPAAAAPFVPKETSTV